MAATDALAKDNLSGARHGSRPHVLRRIGGIIFGVVVVGVVIIAGAVTLVPAVTGATPLTVLSGSMEPALPAGSIVVVRPEPVNSIRPGTIISFVDHDPASAATRVVTHRVIDVRDSPSGPLFATKGDANEEPDAGLTAAADVRGVLWYHVPLVGGARAALLSPAGMFYLAGALLVLVAAHFLVPATARPRASRR